MLSRSRVQPALKAPLEPRDKVDGGRLIARQHAAQVRLWTRPGSDYSERFTRLREAQAGLPVELSCSTSKPWCFDGRDQRLLRSSCQRCGSAPGARCRARNGSRHPSSTPLVGRPDQPRSTKACESGDASFGIHFAAGVGRYCSSAENYRAFRSSWQICSRGQHFGAHYDHRRCARSA